MAPLPPRRHPPLPPRTLPSSTHPIQHNMAPFLPPTMGRRSCILQPPPTPLPSSPQPPLAAPSLDIQPNRDTDLDDRIHDHDGRDHELGRRGAGALLVFAEPGRGEFGCLSVWEWKWKWKRWARGEVGYAGGEVAG